MPAQNVLMGNQPHYIREWRKHRHLTIDQLAERIGITKSYVSKIENGKRRYDQLFLEAAAEVLNCSPADLIIRDPTAPQPIWSIWDQVPEARRDVAIDMLKGLAKTGTKD
jgi:transcriptional regulator with XRE-family HTH domain